MLKITSSQWYKCISITCLLACLQFLFFRSGASSHYRTASTPLHSTLSLNNVLTNNNRPLLLQQTIHKGSGVLTWRHICTGRHHCQCKYRCSHSHRPRTRQVCTPRLCTHMMLQWYKEILWKTDHMWCGRYFSMHRLCIFKNSLLLFTTRRWVCLFPCKWRSWVGSMNHSPPVFSVRFLNHALNFSEEISRQKTFPCQHEQHDPPTPNQKGQNHKVRTHIDLHRWSAHLPQADVKSLRWWCGCPEGWRWWWRAPGWGNGWGCRRSGAPAACPARCTRASCSRRRWGRAAGGRTWADLNRLGICHTGGNFYFHLSAVC